MAEVAAATGFFGALLGSFLNVVVHRLPRGESVVRPGPAARSAATCWSPGTTCR